MFSNAAGGAGGGGGPNSGVQICVEPLCEWKVQEINYAGTEQYTRPQDFNGLLGKNARRVNWRKIVGNDASFDWLSAQEDEAEQQRVREEEGEENGEPEREATTAKSGESELGREKTAAAKNLLEPVAGPWAAVSKHLHHALQEVHILLDALRISASHPSTQQQASIQYLGPVVNALVQDGTEADQQNLARNFQLCTRKKAIMEAAHVINAMAKHRNAQSGLGGIGGGVGIGQGMMTPASEDSDESNFSKELRELRENWRIRKVGTAIFGDLGYKTYSPKFAAHEVFDLVQKSIAARREATLSHSNPSYIGVHVPHNLRRQAKLLVFIENDDERTAQTMFRNGRQNAEEGREMDEADEEQQIKHIHWKRALPWAQETLICRDILAQLVAQSISQPQTQPQQNAPQLDPLITICTERSVAIALFDNLLLRVELRLYPFEERHFPSSIEEADSQPIPFLAQCLRELFLAEHTTRPKRNQHFVTLPQTSLPESLDFRGPQALSSEEILARQSPPDPLIRKFVACASHFVLVSRVIDFLEAYTMRFTDPQPQWKWIRGMPNNTLISLNFWNRGFENLGKFTSYIRIDASPAVTLLTKESQQVNCRRDVAILGEALLILTANFLLNTVNIASRAYGWQVFHGNINAYDGAGNPAPTFYACNQSATKNVFIQFYTDGQCPAIFIKNVCAKAAAEEGEEQTPKKDQIDLDGFVRLNYDRIPGTTFMRKIDILLATFIN